MTFFSPLTRISHPFTPKGAAHERPLFCLYLWLKHRSPPWPSKLFSYGSSKIPIREKEISGRFRFRKPSQPFPLPLPQGPHQPSWWNHLGSFQRGIPNLHQCPGRAWHPKRPKCVASIDGWERATIFPPSLLLRLLLAIIPQRGRHAAAFFIECACHARSTDACAFLSLNRGCRQTVSGVPWHHQLRWASIPASAAVRQFPWG